MLLMGGVGKCLISPAIGRKFSQDLKSYGHFAFFSGHFRTYLIRYGEIVFDLTPVVSVHFLASFGKVYGRKRLPRETPSFIYQVDYAVVNGFYYDLNACHKYPRIL